MNKLITNYLSVFHDELSLLLSYAKDKVEECPEKAEVIFNVFRKNLSLLISWEQDELFPLFESKCDILHETYPTYTVRLGNQHVNMLLSHLSCCFETVFSSCRSGALSAQSLIELAKSIQELENALQQHYIRTENIFYPKIDDSLNKNEIAELFVTMNIKRLNTIVEK